jgi:acyl-CoA thioesterase-2
VPAPLVARLELTEVCPDVFEGAPGRRRHLFGGQLVAQALRAATMTAPPALEAHSVHAHFLFAGAGREPVRYRVERTRDGGSFATRRVVADQGGDPLFLLTASFHRPEPGEEHQVEPALWAGRPDGLAAGRYDSAEVDCRDVLEVPVGEDGSPRRGHWSKVRGRLPDDPELHRAAIGWMSDNGPTRAARQPHADHPGVKQRMSVSLDHSVWFHRPARADEWLFTELRVVSTGRARGLAVGTIHDAGGQLVASVAQEVVLRLPDPGG